MDDLKTLLANPKAQILVFGGALALLGALAWGIGWVAHGLFERASEPPAETAAATSPTAQTPTAPPSSPPAVTPTSASQPTSTPAPTLAPTLPVEEWESIQPGEGLLKVCRRHCPGRWPSDEAGLMEYAQEVARLNNLPWPNPQLNQGQRLRMPPCP